MAGSIFSAFCQNKRIFCGLMEKATLLWYGYLYWAESAIGFLRERGNMSRTTDRAGRNKGQWIVIGFMAFAIIVISICTVIFRSYVRGFHKVTDREKYDRYYVMITEDRKSDFWQSVYRGAFERGQEENVYVDLLGEHLSQEYTRAELMRIAMSSGVDGIFL